MRPSLTTDSCDSTVSCGHRIVLTWVFLCAKETGGRGGVGYRGDISGNPLDTKKSEKSIPNYLQKRDKSKE